MYAAFRETPHQECIHISKKKFASLSFFASTRDIIENPFDLCAGEIRISYQTGTTANLLIKAFGLQFITNGNRQPALPDNRVENRFTSRFIPDQGCFTLVGDTNCRNIGSRSTHFFYHLLRYSKLA